MAADNLSNSPHGAGHEIDAVPGHDLDTVAHEHEKPEDWGWHAEFAKSRQVAGWFCVLVLALYLTGWHYNNAGTFAIVLVMVLMVGGLLVDRHRRRTQWRQ